MTDSFVGEIRMFGGNYAPVGWLLCQGQTLPIAQYPVLYQAIGTTYGGDGVSSFQLPDLSGRFPLHFGAGPGRAAVTQGQVLGSAQVTLVPQQMPGHRHLPAAGGTATTTSAAGSYPAAWADVPYATGTPTTPLSPQQLGAAGGSQPHENRQPYLAVTFIICVDGQYPQA